MIVKNSQLSDSLRSNGLRSIDSHDQRRLSIADVQNIGSLSVARLTIFHSGIYRSLKAGGAPSELVVYYLADPTTLHTHEWLVTLEIEDQGLPTQQVEQIKLQRVGGGLAVGKYDSYISPELEVEHIMIGVRLWLEQAEVIGLDYQNIPISHPAFS